MAKAFIRLGNDESKRFNIKHIVSYTVTQVNDGVTGAFISGQIDIVLTDGTTTIYGPYASADIATFEDYVLQLDSAEY